MTDEMEMAAVDRQRVSATFSGPSVTQSSGARMGKRKLVIPMATLQRLHPPGLAPASPAARPDGPSCLLCGGVNADQGVSKVKVGRVFAFVCDGCAEPVWNLYSLVKWVRGRMK